MRLSIPDNGRKVPVQMSTREKCPEAVVLLDHLLRVAGWFTCSALIDDAKAKCPWEEAHHHVHYRHPSAGLPLELKRIIVMEDACWGPTRVPTTVNS